MKRTVMLLILLLTTGLSLSAQSLDGTWRSYIDIDDDPNGMFIYFTFSGKSDLKTKLTMRIEDDDMGQIDVSYDIPGTYIRQGNVLKVTFDPKHTKPNIDRAVWCKELAVAFFHEPGSEEVMKSMLMEQLVAGNENVCKMFGDDPTLTILDLTAETLMLNDGEETLTFVRYKP